MLLLLPPGLRVSSQWISKSTSLSQRAIATLHTFPLPFIFFYIIIKSFQWKLHLPFRQTIWRFFLYYLRCPFVLGLCFLSRFSVSRKHRTLLSLNSIYFTSRYYFIRCGQLDSSPLWCFIIFNFDVSGTNVACHQMVNVANENTCNCEAKTNAPEFRRQEEAFSSSANCTLIFILRNWLSRQLTDSAAIQMCVGHCFTFRARMI